ncbi:MAG TPA: FeoA family protein [Fervidobacterium sp.]|nr:ferrous iron transport protein A [Fervidobacterium sp.]HOK87441.1 FeoA family protein [Fervidobacterium sp.]HOM73704.1 FeoA family protein [Fervidobacterium sp.]HRD19623.1 FeoA family protein [Fervidobacterium sp.]
MKLSEAPTGVQVEVLHIEESDITPRLRGIGILPGIKIEVLKNAPMGDPRMYRVFSKVITLRNSEANLIEVQVSEDSPLPLTFVRPGDYKVEYIEGGKIARMNLASIGIVEGAVIRLLGDRRVQTDKGIYDVGFGKLSKVHVLPMKALFKADNAK